MVSSGGLMDRRCTCGQATRALSISAVPIRWPEGLMTSSTLPVIQ